MLKLLFALFMLSSSCSQITSTSREYYGDHSGFRNEIVPEVNKPSTSREYYGGHSGFRHGIIPDIERPSTLSQEVIVENLPQDSVERGQALYEVHCLSCHGANGKGSGPQASELDQKPKNLSELAKTVPQFKFYMMVSRQKAQMPGWKTIFTDQEIADLENYLKTL